MEKQTVITKTIFRNNISYLQYDLPKQQAKTSFFDILSLKEGDKKYPEVQQKIHCQNFFSIFWFYNGEGIHTIDFTNHKIEEGDVFFIAPENLHIFRNLKNIDGILICFTEDFLLRLDNNLQNKIKVRLFYPLEGYAHCNISANSKNKIMPCIKRLFEENNIQHKDASLQVSYIASLLSLFLIDMIRLGNWKESTIIDTTSDSYQVYQKFLQLVNEKFCVFHTVKDYTEILGVSQTTLNVYTKQFAKTTPLKIINNRIILEAKRLIRYTPMRIKQISLSLGYEDTSYFIKLFKRNVGISPIEFRELD